MSTPHRPRPSVRWSAVRAALAATGLLGSLLASQSSPVNAADAALFANNGTTGSQLTLPHPIWLPDASGGHVWVGDSLFGFCRIDAPAGGGPGALNPATCDLTAPKAAQAAFDSSKNLVYVADDSTTRGGAVRLKFDPSGSGSIVRGSGVRIGDVGRTNSLALNPADGKLYIGYVRGADIIRVPNPDTANVTTPNASEIVARTSDGRGVRGGLAFVCGGQPSTCDLYIGEVGGNGVTIVPDAQACNPFGAGGCGAVLTSITTNLPGGLTSDGTSLFVGDSPLTNTGTLLRYNPFSDTQDVLSSNITPTYAATYPTSHTQATFNQITGIAITPTGDVYVGDDPTVGAALPPPVQQGRMWRLPGIATSLVGCDAAPGPGCVDRLGGPGQPAQVTPPPSLAKPATLKAWGATSPHGAVWIPNASGGGHYWVGDHTQGLCRLDAAPTHPELLATNPMACDPSGTIGSPGQPVFDPNGNFIYVPDQAVKSPGVWRLNFNPATETVSNPTLMAPGTGLQDDKLDGLAMGPDGNLYAAGLKNGFVFRIHNPRGDPNGMQVDIMGATSDGRGINGTMGFLGNDLYLPENKGLSVISGATGCQGLCPATLLNLPGVPVAVSVATDQKNGVVYVSVAPGAANGTIYRYTPSVGSTIYATRAQLPPEARLPTYTEDCTQSCQRVPEPGIPSDGVVGFHFPLGMYVDPSGNLLVLDDPAAGVRGFHGHVFSVPYTP